MILLGLGLLGWIGYNLLLEMQPEAKGRNPIVPIIISIGLIIVGGEWLLTKREQSKSDS